ncbi:hypothetical protein CPC08DRAFT_770059 [Agrocybe pediades]|nr:hypothetical protein CPC08DRAFT_770059 [Agrocybe pediades]
MYGKQLSEPPPALRLALKRASTKVTDTGDYHNSTSFFVATSPPPPPPSPPPPPPRSYANRIKTPIFISSSTEHGTKCRPN